MCEGGREGGRREGGKGGRGGRVGERDGQTERGQERQREGERKRRRERREDQVTDIGKCKNIYIKKFMAGPDKSAIPVHHVPAASMCCVGMVKC